MNLGDILGGVKKDIGDVASKAIGVTNPSPVAQGFTKNLQHNLGDVGQFSRGVFNGITDPLAGISGGKSGPAGPAAAPTDYWSQAFGANGPYSTVNNIDPNKLMQYYQQTMKGFDPNNENDVLSALKDAETNGYIQPAFAASANNDALSQQAQFQSVIQPFLKNVASQEQQGANQTQTALQGINSQYGSSESPDVKALLGSLDTSINQQAGQDVQYANQAALTTPGISQIIDMLRSQYINSLNNPQGTVTPAKLTAPTTLSAINSALAG